MEVHNLVVQQPAKLTLPKSGDLSLALPDEYQLSVRSFVAALSDVVLWQTQFPFAACQTRE